MYKRAEYQVITDRMNEPRKFIQVVMGARQIGKSTVVKQVLQDLDMPYQFFSADILFCRQCSGYKQCLDFRLLGGCTQFEREPGMGKRHPCN